jgi:hypothetical protein
VFVLNLVFNHWTRDGRSSAVQEAVSGGAVAVDVADRLADVPPRPTETSERATEKVAD